MTKTLEVNKQLRNISKYTKYNRNSEKRLVFFGHLYNIGNNGLAIQIFTDVSVEKINIKLD